MVSSGRLRALATLRKRRSWSIVRWLFVWLFMVVEFEDWYVDEETHVSGRGQFA